MSGDRPATSLHLPRVAQGRLGPPALQGQWEVMAMGQTLLPCGGLTRGQIEAGVFNGLRVWVSTLQKRLFQSLRPSPKRNR